MRRKKTVYVNNNDALIPEYWVRESLAILQDNLVMANLVHRNFENQLQASGDTVNTRKPATFVGKRKTDTDNVTDQDASSTNVAVVLNQHVHISFVIKDGEMSKSFKDLVTEYLTPAVIAEAKFIDQVVLGQAGRFYPNVVGYLGGLSSSNANDYIVDANTQLNVLKAPEMDRSMIWSPRSQGYALKNELFVAADKSGDNGVARREAILGRVSNFNNYSTQLCGEVASTNCDLVTGAIDNSGGYPVGTTALTVDGLSAAISNNTWLSINGDLHRVVSTTGGSTPTAITIDAPGLRRAVINDAVITIVDPAAVNFSSGYAAGYSKYIVIGSFTNAPCPGQLVTFGTSPTSAVYTIVDYDSGTSSILLDRPLEASISNTNTVNLSPPGYYNFAFNKNAIALVTRPLALPPTGAGANAANINYKGLSMRVVMGYDTAAQGLRIVLDMLCGVQQLDTALGVLVLG